MEKRKPLFVYDCEATLQGPVPFAWALTKKLGQTNLSLAEFRALHAHSEAMFPGMADLVRYTATIGNNILLSGANPQEIGCPELLTLKPFFQDWQFNGKDVAWGQTPEQLHKENILIAQALYQQAEPTSVVIIGDSLEEYILARHMAYCMNKAYASDQNTLKQHFTLFLKRGPIEDSYANGMTPVVSVETGAQMLRLLQNLYSVPKRRTRNIHKNWTQKQA